MPKANELEPKPYIFNQQGTGLAIGGISGDIEELADISLSCRHPINTDNLGLKGYIWDVKYNNHNGVVKSVFVKKTAMMDPFKFEQSIDSQQRLPFSMNIGSYRKHWGKFINEKVQRALQDQNSGRHRRHYFAEVLGLQIQIIKPGDGPEMER